MRQLDTFSHKYLGSWTNDIGSLSHFYNFGLHIQTAANVNSVTQNIEFPYNILKPKILYACQIKTPFTDKSNWSLTHLLGLVLHFSVHFSGSWLPDQIYLFAYKSTKPISLIYKLQKDQFSKLNQKEMIKVHVNQETKTHFQSLTRRAVRFVLS